MDSLSLAELRGLPAGAFHFTQGGRPVELWRLSEPLGVPVRAHVRVLGGKGGFGSLLKSFRFHKSDNTDMCRDLSGRRLKDVKEEAKLKAWIAKKAEREAEKERLRQAKYEKLKAGPGKHVFNDPAFRQQGEAILDTIEDAVAAGLRTAEAQLRDGSGPAKRKAEDRAKAAVITKKLRTEDPWMAVDLDRDDLSSDSDDGDEPSPSDDDDEEPSGLDESSQSWVYKAPDPDAPSSSSAPAFQPRASIRSVKASAEAHKAKLMRMLAPKAPAAKAPPVLLKSYEKRAEDAGESVAEVPEEKEPSAQTETEPAVQKEAPVKEKTVKAAELELDAFGAVDLENFASAKEIQEAHGLDHLKAELVRRGLKCGGSGEERAKRLWLVRGLAPDDVPKKLRAAPK